MKTLIRYSNRKLYDTEISKYVTLAQAVSLVKRKVDFRVICYTTKNDITAESLVMALQRLRVENLAEDVKRLIERTI